MGTAIQLMNAAATQASLVTAQLDPAPANPSAWIGYFVAIVLMAMVGIASLWSSKRGHQD